MRRHSRARLRAAGTHQSAWIAGYCIGAAVVAAVVALVSTILAYAQSIGDEAPKINAALRDAERNTAPLGALRTTIEDADAIVGGLQRGRARLGG
ncbi:MAG TPA: hypothetical protein VEL03_04020 [Streptosporangiaceae bacterium]|nr:hypothetical protein [Streptosporangiaceae bacterium]